MLSRAQRQIDKIHDAIARHAPMAADAWLDEMIAAIESLSEMPARCPTAPESRPPRLIVRHLILGNYRILFTIRDRYVRVLGIRHSSREPRS